MLYVEVLKKHCNAVGRTFCDAIINDEAKTILIGEVKHNAEKIDLAKLKVKAQSKNPGLSKALVLQGRQCLKALWLKKNPPAFILQTHSYEWPTDTK